MGRLLVGLSLSVLVAIPVVVVATSEFEGKAKLGPPREVEAEIEFFDDGSTLTITGEAEGLTPGHT